MVGIFLPWEQMRLPLGSYGWSGWDLIRTAPLDHIGILLLLIGGVSVLLGAITSVFRVKNAVYLILVGGILAVFGIPVSIGSSLSYGYYTCLVGSILCVISGVVGLKTLPSHISVKRAKKVGRKVIAVTAAVAIASIITGALAVHSSKEGLIGVPKGHVIVSRIYLKLEASQVTLRVDNFWSLGEIDNILTNNEIPIINVVTPYNMAKGQITVEIGRDVTKERIENLIDNKARVLSVVESVSDATRDEVIRTLKMRVDPYGTLGSQFSAVGGNLIRVQIALPVDNVIELLGHQGQLEMFIENKLVLSSDDITSVGSVQLDVESNSYSVPFDLSQNGADKWASASAGKADYPTAIYVDRPSDETILLFDEGLLEELQGMTYDENRKMFYLPSETLGENVMGGVYLRVTSVKTNVNTLPPETLEFLREQYGVKTRILLLGKKGDFSENVLSTIENLGYPSPGEVPRLPNENSIDWVERACGLISAPTITDAVAGKPLTSLVITTGGNSDAARKRAEDLRNELSQRLPVGISFESSEQFDVSKIPPPPTHSYW